MEYSSTHALLDRPVSGKNVLTAGDAGRDDQERRDEKFTHIHIQLLNSTNGDQ